MTEAPLSPAFWRQAWTGARARSVLTRTQEERPADWAALYEQVADVWLEAQGSGWRMGAEIADVLERNGIVTRGTRILDVGCGPGTLAIPLAQRGAHVTAVDASARMIERLARSAATLGLSTIDTRVVDWCALDPSEGRDVVLASCFPPALSPEGIDKLEQLAQRWCVVVLGFGVEPFPFRARLWHRLVSHPLPMPTEQLVCLVGYLLATDRRPALHRAEWRAEMDVEAERLQRFYERYFEMLASDDDARHAVRTAVEAEIGPHVRDGRCRAEGRAAAAMVWWPGRALGSSSWR